MLASEHGPIVVEHEQSVKTASLVTETALVKAKDDQVSVCVCQVKTEVDSRSANDLVSTSEVTVSQRNPSHEVTNADTTTPSQPLQKRSMSVTFSTTIKRNGSTFHAADLPSCPAIKEVPSETSPDEILFAPTTFGPQTTRLSLESNESSERIGPLKRNSVYHRPSIRGRNISFSTARRCSEFRQTRDHSIAGSAMSSWSYQSKIYQETAKPIYDAENELVTVSRTLLKLQKYLLLTVFLGVNAILIWATFTHYSHIWWFILPILSINTFTQVLMALSIVVAIGSSKLGRLLRKPKEDEPAEAEKIVMLLPCYNEDRNEMQASINSLVRQTKIDKHPRVIMIVVDGNAKAPGEAVSTQEFLLNDMLAGGERTVFTNGYIARDGQPMSVTVQEGMYQGIPYMVIAKARNQGKRDSLCFVRSFMWHYQNQSDEVPTMFDPDLFDYLGSILTDNGLDKVDYLTGMDGDTVFEDDCTYELIKAVRRAGPNVVGVCGAVLVKFDDAPPGFFAKLSFYFWTLLQNAEYMSTQGLRREFQSRVTGKVNCLPGCCQLIRVSEATFGDQVLRVKFGYVPKPNDLMTQQIMGVYSEDSLHASIIFSLFPNSQTAQALSARAYTTVPTSLKVYLSQRKRWALGSLCNESLMVFRPNILWIERLSSVVTIATWWIGPFVYSSVIAFLMAIGRRGLHLFDDKVFVGLIGVILFRYFYTLMIVTWFPHNWVARGRFLIGFFMNLVLSPLVNITVTMYSLMHCDEFSWGKTRISAEGDTGHGGLSVEKLTAQQSILGQAHMQDIESQSPSFQQREEHAMEKFSQKSSPFG